MVQSAPVPPARNLKKAITRLRDALIFTDLAIPLFILIAQQRGTIIYKTNTEHLKLVGDLYDKVLCIMEYIVFMVVYPNLF